MIISRSVSGRLAIAVRTISGFGSFSVVLAGIDSWYSRVLVCFAMRSRETFRQIPDSQDVNFSEFFSVFILKIALLSVSWAASSAK